MHNVRKLFATSVIAAACAVPAALLLSATASADPVPAPPAMPNIPFLSGFSPANAPAMLQGLASAFTGAATPAAAPAAAPAPAATASVTLPQPAAAPTAPVAATPAAAPAAPGLIPTAEVQIPQVANNPLPLPKELSFPGDLTSLMPPGLPLAGLLPKSAPAAVAAAPVAAAVPATAAAAPALPAATAGLDSLAPLMFPVAGLP